MNTNIPLPTRATVLVTRLHAKCFCNGEVDIVNITRNQLDGSIISHSNPDTSFMHNATVKCDKCKESVPPNLWQFDLVDLVEWLYMYKDLNNRRISTLLKELT